MPMHPTEGRLSSYCRMCAAGDGQRWIDSGDNIRHQKAPRLTASSKLARVG